VAARRVKEVYLAGAGPEIVEGILGVDAHLDGVLERLKIVKVLAQSFPERDADLFLHQVDAVDLLGHRMLDLDAGVHLHEVEILFVVDEEFERAGVLIIDGVRQLDRGLAHRLAHGGRDEGGRRFLKQFLVAALDGAVAFADMDNFSVMISKDLKTRCGADFRSAFQDKAAPLLKAFRLPSWPS